MITAERLQMLRTRLGLSQGQLHAYTRIPQSTISNLENGSGHKTFGAIGVLARYYGVSTDYLLGLTDDPTPAGEVNAIARLHARLSPERQRDLLNIADGWLREESPAYQDELLVKLIEEHEGDEETRELLDELLKRLRGDD